MLGKTILSDCYVVYLVFNQTVPDGKFYISSCVYATFENRINLNEKQTSFAEKKYVMIFIFPTQNDSLAPKEEKYH